MTSSPALLELAAAFWRAAGAPGPFPRCLRRPMVRALPLSLEPLSGLRVATVRAWLEQRGIACPWDVADRPLRACLVVRSGYGLVFVDAADPEDEQRFSLAHELAHFLRDYWQPRERARGRLGEAVQEVFDGQRPPTPAERFHALLACVPLGFHTHLMARGDEADHAVEPAERAADRLAWELLAPAATVLAAPVQSQAALAAELRTAYGLPPTQARAYAAALCPEPVEDRLLRQFRVRR